MKLVDCIYVFLLSRLCQAEKNFTDPSVRTEEEINSNLYLQKFTSCSFTLKMQKNSSHEVVALAEDSAVVLLEEICSNLGCGSLFQLNKSRLSDNATCFHRCLYQDGLLQNCSLSHNNCTLISSVVCGHQAMRLAGGSDRCAGRVELWRSGRWGTVCDDHWDLQDADVVCAQLGCGYALSVTGQGGPFPPGRGPVYLDDLNCTGKEDNLWSCPAVVDESDCGHKEDAGVTCSEMRAVRLTGGLDRCSGRVEIHRNGSWGSVCDNCWNERLASMVCTMLECGTKAIKFSQFVPPFDYNKNDTQWYYSCSSNAQNLWECREIINSPYLCKDSKASGVICNGSLGLPTVDVSNSTVNTSLTTEGPTATVPVEKTSIFSSLLSPELLSTIALALLLFVFLITNTVLCCHYKKRYVVLLQQSSSNRKGPSDCYTSYKDTVNLTKVTNNSPQRDVSNQLPPWTQLNDDGDASVHADYEPSFRIISCLALHLWLMLLSRVCACGYSKKYKRVENSATGHSDADRVSSDVMGTTSGCPEDLHYARVSKVSADSFDSTSTSSGEYYENTTRQNLAAPDMIDPGPSQSPVSGDHLGPYSGSQFQGSGNEDNGPLYSPVSLEEPSLSDDEYDDVES